MHSHKIQDPEKWWDLKEEELALIEHSYGQPIDLDIRRTVLALRAFGIKTHTSCQGHSSDRKSYPFITIGTERAGAVTRNLRMRRTVSRFIAEFDHTRQIQRKVSWNTDQRLILQYGGKYGSFILQSAGAERLAQTLHLPWVRRHYLKRYQEEMFAFGEFLTKRFFNPRSSP